jgi:hypothetical protein
MKNIFCGIIIFSFLYSCYNSSTEKSNQELLKKIKTGMNYVEVATLIGTPDTIIHVGVMLDEFGSQIKTDEWWYGKNIVLVMVNDTVNAIDPDAIGTEKRIQHIIDSAKAADGNGNSFIHPSSN